MPSDIAENFQKNIHDASTFKKRFLVVDKLTIFYKYFKIFVDILRVHLTKFQNGYEKHLCWSSSIT